MEVMSWRGAASLYQASVAEQNTGLFNKLFPFTLTSAGGPRITT